MNYILQAKFAIGAVRYANGYKNLTNVLNELNMQRQPVFKTQKISRRRPRSVDDAELGHFRLLFYSKEMYKYL